MAVYKTLSIHLFKCIYHLFRIQLLSYRYHWYVWYRHISTC